MTEEQQALMERFLALSDGGDVRRFHATPLQRTQTNAQHSWAVATLASILWPEGMSLSFLQAILWHDCSEAVTGDIPSPAKQSLPLAALVAVSSMERMFNAQFGVKGDFTTHERAVLKFCDAYECAFFAAEEANMGSPRALRIAREAKANAAIWIGSLPPEVRERAEGFMSILVVPDEAKS